MANANRLIRIGIVSQKNADGSQARVFFPDQGNMVSGWLYVLQFPVNGQYNAWAPEIGNKVVTAYTYGDNTDGYILGVIP